VPITVKVRDMMDKNLVFIESGTSVSEVIKRMVKENVWSVLVSKKGLPVGVVTERDVLRRCLAKGTSPDRVKAEDIMSAPLLTIDPDASIGEAMHLLITKDVRRLYVVDGGRAVGRITQTSVFNNVFESMESLLTAVY
jgi:predicted transcriptional regulator